METKKHVMDLNQQCIDLTTKLAQKDNSFANKLKEINRVQFDLESLKNLSRLREADLHHNLEVQQKEIAKLKEDQESKRHQIKRLTEDLNKERGEVLDLKYFIEKLDEMEKKKELEREKKKENEKKEEEGTSPKTKSKSFKVKIKAFEEIFKKLNIKLSFETATFQDVITELKQYLEENIEGVEF